MIGLDGKRLRNQMRHDSFIFTKEFPAKKTNKINNHYVFRALVHMGAASPTDFKEAPTDFEEI